MADTTTAELIHALVTEEIEGTPSPSPDLSTLALGGLHTLGPIDVLEGRHGAYTTGATSTTLPTGTHVHYAGVGVREMDGIDASSTHIALSSVALPTRPHIFYLLTVGSAYSILSQKEASETLYFLSSPSISSLRSLLTTSAPVRSELDAGDGVGALFATLSFAYAAGGLASIALRLVAQKRDQPDGGVASIAQLALLRSLVQVRVDSRPSESWWMGRFMDRVETSLSSLSLLPSPTRQGMQHPGKRSRLPLAGALRHALSMASVEPTPVGAALVQIVQDGGLEKVQSGEKVLKALDSRQSTTLTNTLPLAWVCDAPIASDPEVDAVAALVRLHETHVGTKFFPFLNSEARYITLLTQLDIESGQGLSRLYARILDPNATHLSDQLIRDAWVAETPSPPPLAQDAPGTTSTPTTPGKAGVTRVHALLRTKAETCMASAGIVRSSSWACTLEVARSTVDPSPSSSSSSSAAARSLQSPIGLFVEMDGEARAIGIGLELSLTSLALLDLHLPVQVDPSVTNVGRVIGSYVREAVLGLEALSFRRLALLLSSVFALGWNSPRSPHRPAQGILAWDPEPQSLEATLMEVYDGLECVITLAVENGAPSFVPTWLLVQDVKVGPEATERLHREGLFGGLTPEEKCLEPVLILLLAVRSLMNTLLALVHVRAGDLGHAYVNVLHMQQLIGFKLLEDASALVFSDAPGLDDVGVLSFGLGLIEDEALRNIVSFSDDVFVYHEAPYTVSILEHRTHVLYEKMMSSHLSLATPVPDVLALRARWEDSYARLLAEKEVLDEIPDKPEVYETLAWTRESVLAKGDAAFTMLESLETERGALDSLLCVSLLNVVASRMHRVWSSLGLPSTSSASDAFVSAVASALQYTSDLYTSRHHTPEDSGSGKEVDEEAGEEEKEEDDVMVALGAKVDEVDERVSLFCKASSSAVNTGRDACASPQAVTDVVDALKNLIRLFASVVCVVAADALFGSALASQAREKSRGGGEEAREQLVDQYGVLSRLLRQGWFYWASGGVRSEIGKSTSVGEDLVGVFEGWMWEFHDLEELGILWHTAEDAGEGVGRALLDSAVRTVDDVLEVLCERRDAIAVLSASASSRDVWPEAEVLAKAGSGSGSSGLHATPLRAELAVTDALAAGRIDPLLAALEARELASIRRQRRKRLFLRHIARVQVFSDAADTVLLPSARLLAVL